MYKPVYFVNLKIATVKGYQDETVRKKYAQNWNGFKNWSQINTGSS